MNLILRKWRNVRGLQYCIPCGRGDGGETPILFLLVTSIVGFGSVQIITPAVIGGTMPMLLMYMSVYGVSMLRLDARSGGCNHGDNADTNSTRRSAIEEQQGMMSRIKRSVLMCMTLRCCSRNTRSDSMEATKVFEVTPVKKQLVKCKAAPIQSRLALLLLRN